MGGKAVAHGSEGSALRLTGVAMSFGTHGVLEPLDLDVASGEFLAILGPSGCGKSTLLRLVAGLERAQAGTIALRGCDPVSFVFQDPYLLPWRTVLGNVMLPLEIGRAASEERARETLRQVGLADATDRYPAELSGGMRMRASLARALVVEPRLLLLDEPFAALDAITRERLQEELRSLWRDRGLTVLFVTHAIAEAAFLAERVVVLSSRPARVVADRALALAPERTAALRTAPAYSAELAALRAALAEGMR